MQQEGGVHSAALLRGGGGDDSDSDEDDDSDDGSRKRWPFQVTGGRWDPSADSGAGSLHLQLRFGPRRAPGTGEEQMDDASRAMSEMV